MTIQAQAATVVFENVSKRFGGITAVRDVSFELEVGTLVTLLGPSGCGKTTTLRMIAGLERASAGNIRIGGKDVTLLPATERDVTMVFQSYALFPHMTVAENVSYGLRVGGADKSAARSRAEEGLKLVGLASYGERMPSELSGGQQQRIAVARALVLEPQVLLFDEPLSNLDARLRRQVRGEIRDLQRSLGVTAVYVTHDQQEALAVSDRIIVMNNAEIAQDGKPRELYEHPASRFVANFIGDANLLEVRIESVEDGTAVVALGRLQLRLPSRGLAAGPAHLAIRPEAVILSASASAPPDGDTFAGTVTKTTYLGNHVEYSIHTDFGKLFVVDPNISDMFEVDAPLLMRLSERGVTLVES